MSDTKQNFLVKGHTKSQKRVPLKDENVLKLEATYNEIIDSFTSRPVTGKNNILSPNDFYRRLASWMALAMAQCAIEKIESNPEHDFGIDMEDLCQLPDDLKGLHTISDILQFIDSLDERARNCDGKPFGNWSVRDIVGTIRGENFDSHYEELLNHVVETTIPNKK
ncbi:MAG: hypothetical protein KBT39_07500 [Bacteroidales bacterium]|nr:hypothetical protein [Bacteroidales bacterium]